MPKFVFVFKTTSKFGVYTQSEGFLKATSVKLVSDFCARVFQIFHLKLSVKAVLSEICSVFWTMSDFCATKLASFPLQWRTARTHLNACRFQVAPLSPVGVLVVVVVYPCSPSPFLPAASLLEAWTSQRGFSDKQPGRWRHVLPCCPPPNQNSLGLSQGGGLTHEGRWKVVLAIQGTDTFIGRGMMTDRNDVHSVSPCCFSIEFTRTKSRGTVHPIWRKSLLRGDFIIASFLTLKLH